MASVNENIARAMDVLISKRLGSLAMDQTIIAEITEVVNSAKGHYKIKYQNVIVDAYSENTDKTYKNGDTVYVKIPNSDFSAKKMIEGKVPSDTSLLEGQMQNLKNYLIPVTPAIGINFNNTQEIGLIAGVSQALEINSFTYDIENFSILSNLYDIVQIEAKFRTAFSSEHQSGNYGIKVKCKISDDDNIEYILDTSNFRGNFYNYNSGAIQTVRLQIPKGTLKEIESITFFEEMEQDGDNAEKANIFVENINISFFEAIDFTEYEYYLYVNALQGYEFTANTSLLQFQPKCLHKGEEISGESGYQIYWYKKNAPSEGKTYADSNWALIETKDKTANEYLDNNLLCVNKINNISNSEYKVIFKDNEDLFLEKEFIVYNTQNKLPKIIQKTNLQDKSTTLYLEDNPKSYTTLWESNGKKIERDKSSEGQLLEQITIKISDFTSKFLEIICYFYQQNVEGEQICIGSVKYLLAPVEENKDIDVVFEGIDYFQYDTNGDMYLEDASREKMLKVKISSKEGYMAQVENIKFYLNEHEILKEKTNESYLDSMLKEVWVDSEYYIHYILQPTYSLSRNKNVIKVQITLVSGQELIFTKELMFNKIGNIGTNNSSYAISLEAANGLIAYDNFNENYNIKLKIYYQGKEMSQEEINMANVTIKELKINEYRIQNETFENVFDFNNLYSIPKEYFRAIPNISTYNYNTFCNQGEIVSLIDENTGFLKYYEARQNIDENSQLTNENGQIVSDYKKYWRLIEDERGIFGGNYVTITISINNNIITSYLPIPVTINNNDNKEKNDIYISDLALPQTIRYSSHGNRPQYYNTTEINENKISLYLSTPNSFKPAYEFDFEQLNNNDKYYLAEIIQITTPSSDIIYWPVIYYLNTYGNSAINNWSGEEMEVDGGSILANQIIAGRKESGTNRFTGVALGEVEDEEVIYSGMYGYNNGINTFGLRSDGTAYFGMGKNIQINGEGKTAIQVGDIEIENNEIQGNGFLVDFNGNVYLSGTIHATNGNIGGWNITEDGLQAYRQWDGSNKETAILLHPDNVQLPEVCIYHSGYGEDSRGYLGFQFGNNEQPVLSLQTLTNGIYLNPYYEDTNENGYMRFSSEAMGFDRGKNSSAQEMAKHIYLGKGSGGKTLHNYIEDMITTAINKLPIGGGSEE